MNFDYLQTTAGMEISEAQLAINAHAEDTRGQLSDGYHTFDELYEHRIILFIALCHVITNSANTPVPDYVPWKSRKHSDGSEWDGWFVAGIGKEKGSMLTYHLPNRLWNKIWVEELTTAPEFDGHTPTDVLKRLSEKFL